MKSILVVSLALLPLAPLAAQDIPLSQILVEKESWKPVAAKLPGVTHLDAAAKVVGVYQGAELTQEIEADGTVRKPDSVEPRFRPRTLATVEAPAVADGMKFVERYHIEVQSKSVVSVQRKQILRLKGLAAPTALALWPDKGHLVIGEADGGWLWAVRIEADGSFGPGDRYYSLRTRPDIKMHVSAIVLDAEFLLYAATPIGIQVFDPTGRLSGVVAAPSQESMTAITIGGANADQLFVAAGDTVYARRIQKKAAYTRAQK